MYSANLQGANLQEANLQGANLQYADLEGANLQGANLQEANLTDAYASSANFTDAKLNGADFKRTNLIDATLNEISNVKNLTLEEIPLIFTIDGIEYTQYIKEKELIKLLLGTSYFSNAYIGRTLLYNINNPLTSTQIATLAGLKKSQNSYPSTFVKGKFSELLKEEYAELIITPKTKGNFKKIYLTLKEEFYRRLISEATTNENLIAES